MCIIEINHSWWHRWQALCVHGTREFIEEFLELLYVLRFHFHLTLTVVRKLKITIRHNLNFSSRTFHVYAPRIWNIFPSSVRDCKSLTAFRHNRYTHCFQPAFTTQYETHQQMSLILTKSWRHIYLLTYLFTKEDLIGMLQFKIQLIGSWRYRTFSYARLPIPQQI